jgi:hypothetical protein
MRTRYESFLLLDGHEPKHRDRARSENTGEVFWKTPKGRALTKHTTYTPMLLSICQLLRRVLKSLPATAISALHWPGSTEVATGRATLPTGLRHFLLPQATKHIALVYDMCQCNAFSGRSTTWINRTCRSSVTLA